VRTACHQFIPSAIREDAPIYVGMHADIEIQRAAMSLTPQRRWSSVVGARSGLTWNESAGKVVADKVGLASIDKISQIKD
jgi:hypothetical protein